MIEVEYVQSGDKPPPKAKGKKKSEEGKAAGSLEDLVASQGLSMQDMLAHLVALRSPPAGSQPPDPSYTTKDGLELLRDLIVYCRKGEFRIS
jgi:hypothetical protein